MNTTYGSKRYRLTNATLIITIIKAILSGLIGLGCLTLSGSKEFLESMEGRLSSDPQMISMAEALGYGGDLSGFAQYVIQIGGGFFVVIFVCSIIAIVISAVSLVCSHKQYVTFVGDAVFKIVINGLATLLFGLSLLSAPTVMTFIIVAFPASILILSIVCMASKLEPNNTADIYPEA